MSEENAVIVEDTDLELDGQEGGIDDVEETPKPGAGDETPSIRELREENSRLRRESEERLQEARQLARETQELHAKLAQPAAPAAPAENPDDFVDELTKIGMDAIRKRSSPGATESQVREIFREEIAAVMKRADLVSRYPEINDPTSRFHKLMTEEQEINVKRDPSAVNNINALESAARTAKFRLDAERREGDRSRRVNASSGFGMERYDNSSVNDGAMRLTQENKYVASAMGIPKNEFKDVLMHKVAIAKSRQRGQR